MSDQVGSLRIIEPAAWVAQPWRNGAGVTHEIARWPARDPFEVRISVAALTSPSTFSRFEGYRRWLTLLDGGPLALEIAGVAHVLRAPGDGVAFAGEAAASVTSIARPGRVLNVFVREPLAAEVAHVRGPVTRVIADGVAVFALAGDVVLGAAGRAVAPLPGRALAWDVAPLAGDGDREPWTLGLGPEAVAIVLTASR